MIVPENHALLPKAYEITVSEASIESARRRRHASPPKESLLAELLEEINGSKCFTPTKGYNL